MNVLSLMPCSSAGISGLVRGELRVGQDWETSVTMIQSENLYSVENCSTLCLPASIMQCMLYEY